MDKNAINKIIKTAAELVDRVRYPHILSSVFHDTRSDHTFQYDAVWSHGKYTVKCLTSNYSLLSVEDGDGLDRDHAILKIFSLDYESFKAEHENLIDSGTLRYGVIRVAKACGIENPYPSVERPDVPPLPRDAGYFPRFPVSFYSFESFRADVQKARL